MRSCRTIFTAVFGLLIAEAAFAGQLTECDRLCGSPTDPQRVGPGIGLYGIDPVQAIPACEKALTEDLNNPRLLFNLGRAHEARSIVEHLPDETAAAVQSYKAAADLSYPAAQVVAAQLYWYGIGLQQDSGEAMRLLEKAATSDASEAKALRRRSFRLTAYPSEKPSEAQIRSVKEAADAGDADALYALGAMASFGGKKADAVRLWQKAAVSGSARAALDLADMYFQGDGGLSKDWEEARHLIQQAAAGDDPVVRVSAAIRYENGDGGMPKDENLAARLYKQASDEGVPYPQDKLAQFYEEGKGGLPDDRYEARRLYRLAADQGREDAVVALAHYMAEGLGGFEPDKAKAVEFLRHAASWSDEAKEELAKMGG